MGGLNLFEVWSIPSMAPQDAGSSPSRQEVPMDMSSRTALAWLKAQRPETRRPWQGHLALVPSVDQASQAPAPKPTPKAEVLLPAPVLINTLLG